VVFGDWVAAGSTYAWVAFAELMLFIAILLVGLVWVWGHGDLEWMKKLARLDDVEPEAGTAPRKAA
jgi:NADH-quinone oxidoreductase subunit A